MVNPIIGYRRALCGSPYLSDYSLKLMRAKDVGSKNRSETELDEVKVINSMITQL